MTLEKFRDKLKDYCRDIGTSQKILALELGYNPKTLNQKLNGSNNTILSQQEAKDIIKQLIKWGAVVHQSQVLELLEILELSDFSSAEWNSPPLNSIETQAYQARSAIPNENYTNNLPAPLTKLVKRQIEIAHINNLLCDEDIRLLTLVGPGGVGKTRLVIAAARSVLKEFQDGVFFVSLAPISDPALLVSTIAGVLGVKEVSGKPLIEVLKKYLHNKQLLLVLDNFEQILLAAPTLNDFLASSTGLKIIVTSRALLSIYGEYEYVVPPLDLPSSDSKLSVKAMAEFGSVALFLQRAKAAGAAFQLTSENVDTVCEICVQLDGLPLAIELAAAFVKRFTPNYILAHFSSRLNFLVNGPQDLPARQRSLRAAIDWSYDLLETEEKMLFSLLGVFVGGFDAEAIHTVFYSGDVYTLDHTVQKIDSLVNQNLLTYQIRSKGTPRFFMLDIIREYVLELITKNEKIYDIYQTHAEYYLNLAQTAQPELRGPRQQFWFYRFEEEQDNFRAALRWLLQQNDILHVEKTLQLCAALGYFWYAYGPQSEGLVWLELALAKIETFEDDISNTLLAAKAAVLFAIGRLMQFQGNLPKAKIFYQESLILRRKVSDKIGIAEVLNNLGLIEFLQGNLSDAQILYEESLSLRRALDFKRGIADTLNNLAILADINREFAKAISLYKESLLIRRELEDKQGEAESLNNLGLLCVEQGIFDQARIYYNQCLDLQKVLKYKRGISTALINLGRLLYLEGEYDKAKETLHEALILNSEIGDKITTIDIFDVMAMVAVSQGFFERATKLFGAANDLRQSTGIPIYASDVENYNKKAEILRTSLGETNYALFGEQGRAMTLEKAIVYALEV